MNCARYSTELEDFPAGELSASRTAEVRAHLAACAACAAGYAELERERELFAAYYEQTAREPAAEMWDAIRGRIGAQAETRMPVAGHAGRLRGVFAWLLRPAVLRQAVLAAALIVISVAATALYFSARRETQQVAGVNPTPTPRAMPVASPTPAVPDNPAKNAANVARPALRPVAPRAVNRPVPPPAPLSEEELLQRQVARAEREYQNVIKLLDRAVAKRRADFEPELVKQYEGSLALIDQSIAQSRRALHADPHDPRAGRFLLAAYARKVDLMQEIAMR